MNKLYSVLIVMVFISQPAIARTLAEINQTKEIRLCTAGSSSEYYKEMGLAFAKWLNVNAKIRQLPSWDHQFHNEKNQTVRPENYTPRLLESGECDCYPNDLVINEWRKKKLAFVPLYETRTVVLVHKDNLEKFQNQESLKGHTAAIMQNTSYHTWLDQKNQGEFLQDPIKIEFMKTYDAWDAVTQKQVDFTLSNATTVFKELANWAKDLRIAFSVGSPAQLAWAFNKDNETLILAAKLFVKRQMKKNSDFDLIWQARGTSITDYMDLMKAFSENDQSDKALSRIVLSEKEKEFLLQHPLIIAHNETDWAPFNFNVEETPKGFSIDYLKLLAEILNVEVQFLQGPSWDEFLELAKSGALDVMLNIAKTPDRETYLEFTPPYVEMVQQLYTRKDFPAVKSIRDLSGKIFAVPKGFYLQEVLQKYPEIELLKVENTTEAIHKVSVGKADAFFDIMPVVSYLMEQLQVTNLKVGGDLGITEGSPIPLHFAVSQKMRPLAGILSKAMLAVTDDELRLLRKKWLGAVDAGTETVALTQKEKGWLAALDRPLAIANEMDWPPFDFAVDGEARGLSIEILRLAAQKTGLALNFINGYSWAVLMEKFIAGDIDVLPAVYLTPERKEAMAFTSAYATNPSVIVVRAEQIHIKTLEDLNNKKVAVIFGFATANVMQERYPNIEQLLVKNVEEGLKAVSLRSADAFIGSMGTITNILDTRVIPDLRITDEVWLKKQEETELHMGVRKEDIILRDILQKGFDAITTEEMRDIRRRWLSDTVTGGRGFKEVILTTDERRWLSEYKFFRLGDDFSLPPFSFFDENDQFSGIAAGYANAVSERLGIELKPVMGLTWNAVMEKIKKGEIDILPAVTRTPERETFLNFTKPYISFPVVIATRKDGIFVDNLNDLLDEKVGVVSGYVTQEFITKDYPGLVLVPHKNLATGLEALNRGDIIAFIDNLGSITYEIERQKLENIKIAAPTDYRFDLSFGVRKDWPQMAEIMDKAIETIEERERTAIKNTWMAIEVKYGIDLKTIVLWVAPFAVSAILIIGFVVVWNRRLEKEITHRKKAEKEVRKSHQIITSSINYASHIQRSVLPMMDLMDELLDEGFVLWEPRDVVGGDIYWGKKWGEGSLVILADCTGHGVPGAFMTLISSGALDHALTTIKAGDAAALIRAMHQIIQQMLSQDTEVCDADHCSDDGLEMGVCFLPQDKTTLIFAGAGFPLFFTKGNSIVKIKGDRKGIGYRSIPQSTTWTNKVLDIQSGQSFYMSSDGIFDQVGGPMKRGFGTKRFIKLLEDIQTVPIKKQGRIIYEYLERYQGDESRRDDVSAIGFKI